MGVKIIDMFHSVLLPSCEPFRSMSVSVSELILKQDLQHTLKGSKVVGFFL